tara:strand:+ start:394 stop:1272 length:879 start_codon:yes stop_codon:yes gene_type:complete
MTFSKISTVVIPIAGMGTRFLPITKAVSKEMLNLLDRPLIDYAFNEAKEAGIKKFIIVADKENKLPIKYFSKNKKLDKFLIEQGKHKLLHKVNNSNLNKSEIKLVIQNKPSGLGNAILRTEKYIGKKDFCVLLPDDLILGNNCLKELIDVYNKKKSNVIGVMEVEKRDVNKYGIIKHKESKSRTLKVIDLVEKPNVKLAPSNLAIVGRYILKNSIFDYLKKIKKGSGGEFQLTDAISLSNKTVNNWGHKFTGTRYDCGSKIGFFSAQLALALVNKEIKKDVKKIIKKVGKKI